MHVGAGEVWQMDFFDKLAVRFHYNGEFYNDGKRVVYCGGLEGMPYMDKDKMSLLEIRGHLEDYCKGLDMVKMHWLFPDKRLFNGLWMLSDDKAC